MINERITEFQKWVREHPLAGSFAAIACMVVLTKPASLLYAKCLQGLMKETAGVLTGIFAAWLIVRLFGFRWLYRHGSGKETLLAGLPQLLFYGFMLGMMIMNAVTDPNVHWAGPVSFLVGLLRLFQIGYLEEAVFRGIISNLLGFHYGKDAKGIWTAVLFSSAVFGLVHVTNVLNGVTFLNALLQSLIAAIMGIYLCAVYYRGRSLWAMIFIHAVTDSLGLFRIYFAVEETAQSEAGVINSISPVTILYVLIYAAIGVFLLRKKKMDGVISAMDAAKAIDGTANA